MDGFVNVGKLSSFKPRKGRKVRVGEEDVAVFRLGDEVHAVANPCPHMGAELADGKLDGFYVICHWHHWTFDLRDGHCPQRKWAAVRTYATRVADGEVWVERPPRDDDGDDDDEPWVVWDDSKHLKGGPKADGTAE